MKRTYYDFRTPEQQLDAIENDHAIAPCNKTTRKECVMMWKRGGRAVDDCYPKCKKYTIEIREAVRR